MAPEMTPERLDLDALEVLITVRAPYEEGELVRYPVDRPFRVKEGVALMVRLPGRPARPYFIAYFPGDGPMHFDADRLIAGWNALPALIAAARERDEARAENERLRELAQGVCDSLLCTYDAPVGPDRLSIVDAAAVQALATALGEP